MLLVLTGIASAVGANPLEKLVMPGPLISNHAKYEDNCDECHLTFEKESQTTLCLDCHEDVKADVERDLGFHGKSPWVEDAECSHCHTDHIGRDADIVPFSEQLFDHANADFKLEGAHQTLDCVACHTETKKYREADQACSRCHKEDDIHAGELVVQGVGKPKIDCNECHKQTGWKPAQFDHAKTGFKLTEKHSNVRCDSCHVSLPYENTPDACIACHDLNDPHGGEYGDKCETCHTTKGWSKSTFNHNRDTKFTLADKHKDIACLSCHEEGTHRKNLQVVNVPNRQCVDCHKSDDIHKTRLGTKCQNCHQSAGWKPIKFDHGRDTKFTLAGAHTKLDCQDCHLGSIKTDVLSTQCKDCHAMDDPHVAALGQNCAKCHDENDWWQNVRFNHNITNFPLLGMHTIAACEQCHITQTYDVPEANCVDCHRDDDTHKKVLGADCGSCHNPNGWLFWSFDHNRQTEFRLDGSHRKLDCIECHSPASGPAKDLAQTCVSCHQRDDRHRGAFGNRCDDCHVTTDFDSIKKIRPNR